MKQSMGSTYFYENTQAIPNEKIICAVVMDLVGHAVPIPGLENALAVTGAESSPSLAKIVTMLADQTKQLSILPIRTKMVGDMSDYYVFRRHKRPFLFLSCGTGEHYHRETDVVENLDFKKMNDTADFLVNLLYAIDDSPPELLANSYTDPRSFLAIEANTYSRLLGNSNIPLDESTLDYIGNKLRDVMNGRCTLEQAFKDI